MPKNYECRSSYKLASCRLMSNWPAQTRDTTQQGLAS